MNRNKKVTIYDVANALGTSVGTVYRALHNTGRISPATKQQVLDMAEKMGFEANHAAQSLRRKPIHIGVILCCPVQQYLDEIKRGMDAAFDELLQYNVFPDIRLLYGINSESGIETIEALLNEFAEKKVQGAALFLSGDNHYFCPSVERLEQNGVAVATVANDIEDSKRILSVSADGQCAGRLAAEILYLCCPNQRIAILTGSNTTAIHKENLTGFLDYASQHTFSAIDIFEHGDHPEQVIHQIEKIMKAEPPYQGLYITSASSIYACQHIGKIGMGKQMKIVTTDLFKENKELIQNEIVSATIFQNPYKQGKLVIHRLYQYICSKGGEGQTLLMPQAIFRSNMNIFPTDN